MTETFGQLNSICRACLSRDNCTFDIFEGKCSNEQTYCKVLMECAPVQISRNEHLSSLICYTCVMYLEAFITFRTKCIESEYVVNKYLVCMNDDRNGYSTESIKPEIEFDTEHSKTVAENPVSYGSLQADTDAILDLAAANEPGRPETSAVEKKPGRKEDPQQIHVCPTCGRPFSRKSNLKRHMKIHTGEKPYRCNLCFKTFNETWNLKVHKEIHLETNIRTHVDDRESVPDENAAEPAGIEIRSKTYECRVCDVDFGSKDELEEHLKRHVRKRPYKCDFCDKAFLRNQHLIIHRRGHTGERPFACDTCGKSFAAKCHLMTHAYVHTKKRLYACDRCDKSFAWYVHFTDHRRTHTGEKPFACRVCGKSFAQKSQLKTHSNVHVDEKKYECGECGKTFTRSQHLVFHAKSHSNGKTFVSRLRSTAHANDRTNKRRPYRHDETFGRNARLVDKSFKCRLCSKTFHQESRLTVHVRTHRSKRSEQLEYNTIQGNESESEESTNGVIEIERETTLEEPSLAGNSQFDIEHIEIKNEIVGDDEEETDRLAENSTPQ